VDEENEDFLTVEEEVDDFEEEDSTSCSPIFSLISSTSPSTGFEFAIVEENPELASLLEDVVTDSSSMNSEIISATAEDLSEIVPGISAKELG